MSLFTIIYSAYKHSNNIFRSVIGHNVINNYKNNTKSEFNKSHWTICEMLYLFTDIFIPSLPIYCPNWVPNIIKRIIFNGNSEYIADTTYPNLYKKESVLYINGIMTNKSILYQNQHALRALLKRPINLIHNNTDSVILDLIESAIGKKSNNLTEASYVAMCSMSKQLLDPNIEKIILICHSQGTIIASNALFGLQNLGLDRPEYLKKLEIYAFSNCSSNMPFLINNYPYMEHLSNENDFVAKLGSNCNDDIKHLIKIDGIKLVAKNHWGHMFNTHYIEDFQIKFPESKLNNYIK